MNYSAIRRRSRCANCRRIGRLSGLKTRNSVYNHLNRLKETGIVTWEAGESRTLKVLQPEYVISEYLAAVQRKKEDYVYEVEIPIIPNEQFQKHEVFSLYNGEENSRDYE